MSAALDDYYFRFGQFVDEAVFFVDTAAPEAGEFVFQRLRPAQPMVSVAVDVFYELVYPLEDFFVPVMPVQVFIPGFICP